MPEFATIFALSSGQPPAGIAVIRISGSQAGAALMALGGPLPVPRRAALRDLIDPADGALLDRALVLWLPGPKTATGEDLAEIHAHGGRAVVRAIEGTLAALPGLRRAEPGEFTRRALLNGRIDLTEAEGLADLLSAETDAQRRHALLLTDGVLGRQVASWQAMLLAQAAALEALLDFADEDDVSADAVAVARIRTALSVLADDLMHWLARPAVEALHDGVAVVIAGPPNAGKSTLINVIAEREVAIVAPTAGTTRDIVEVNVAIAGVPFRLSDTAGLRALTTDLVEREGIRRAEARISAADLLLWLGAPVDAPEHAGLIRIAAQADRATDDADWRQRSAQADIIVSAHTGQGMDALSRLLVERAGALLPRPGEAALNARQRTACQEAQAALTNLPDDPLLIAEHCRAALLAFDAITGVANTEAMLDTLFNRFCIGK